MQTLVLDVFLGDLPCLRYAWGSDAPLFVRLGSVLHYSMFLGEFFKKTPCPSSRHVIKRRYMHMACQHRSIALDLTFYHSTHTSIPTPLHTQSRQRIHTATSHHSNIQTNIHMPHRKRSRPPTHKASPHHTAHAAGQLDCAYSGASARGRTAPLSLPPYRDCCHR